MASSLHLKSCNQKFSYGRNPVGNVQDCQRLVDAIVNHPSISACYLHSMCAGGMDGHGYLVNLLRKEGMTSLDFANCGVDTAGGHSALFDIVKLHPNLDWLCLDGNKLNDNDAIHLADALRHNSTLDMLGLNGNEFTCLGEDVLKKAIYDDSSLNAVSDSNHVCSIHAFGCSSLTNYVKGRYNVYRNEGDWQVDDSGFKKMTYDPKQSRARKNFHLLEERHKESTNVHHLETEMGGPTLKVVPRALAAIQVYGGQKNSFSLKPSPAAQLSITYELVRGWPREKLK